MRAVDLVVCTAKKAESGRGVFFRFGSWSSHQATNAGRWAHKFKIDASLFYHVGVNLEMQSHDYFFTGTPPVENVFE